MAMVMICPRCRGAYRPGQLVRGICANCNIQQQAKQADFERAEAQRTEMAEELVRGASEGKDHE
ncbi:hypothetical protein D3C77_121790 [compost metagenome]